jgi:predicted acylesterase/phospholipase RssA
MAGGGNKGSFEAGALYGLIRSQETPDPEKFAWDVVTGVSIGSVNMAGIVLWEPGTEWDMV